MQSTLEYLASEVTANVEIRAEDEAVLYRGDGDDGTIIIQEDGTIKLDLRKFGKVRTITLACCVEKNEE